ncbi:tetratricopeptide repeat protein [Patescibacteria group bacterium]|nr:tetratricopeptide repeat protein [Patescibacteria group bacterium]
MKNTLEKSSKAVGTCEKVSRGSIYLLVFLLPILFLPWTANVLDFNKQALLIILVFASLFAWILKALISGKVSFNFGSVHIPVLVLFLIYTASTIFSLWRYGSFWGWPQVSSESLLSLLGLLLLYFLVVNIFEKKEIFRLITFLVVSGFLAMLYGALQLFGKFLFPIDFTKAVSFNTIGGLNSLAVFTAVLLPLIIILITVSTKRYLKIFFIAVAAFSAVLLILINFLTAWWLVIVGSALIIAFGMQKRDIFDSRWLVLPMFFLALALFFSFIRFQIPGLPERPVEVFLTHRASSDISWKALKENSILGSGPGTFVYNFSKYRDISFNQNPLWSVRFEWASSKFLTILATCGILGVLSFLSLIGFFIFYGIKSLFKKSAKASSEALSKDEEGVNKRFFWLLALGIFISFLTLSVGYFFCQSNLSLDFVYFLFMGSFISLLCSAKKEILLKTSSLITLGLTFIFTVVFIFGLGLFILEGQRYVAAVSYLKGLRSWQQGESGNTLKHLERAVRISPGVDLYWREISQVYLQNINEVAGRTDLSQEEITQRLQLYINNAVNSAKAATDTNPKNVANWSVKGFIYQSLIGVIGGTKDWAVDSYKEALELEPNNPYFPAQTGIALLREVTFLSQEKAEEREKILREAQEQFKKAIEMKPDYAPAHFQLAVVYQAQGKQAEMIEELEKTKSFAPFDVGLAFQLGLIYFQKKDYEKALIELERAVILNPDYANALYFLGLTYDELGEKEKAIRVFEKIQIANPDHSLVITILNNLRSGEKALKGVVEEQPPVVPIEEEHPEIEE